MRLHNFFIEQKIGHELIGHELSVPDASLAHQLQNVFRLRSGDGVILLDNSGYKYVSSIIGIDKKVVVFHIEKQESNIQTQSIPHVSQFPRVILFQSLIKKDKFEWVAEKATELGVDTIVPVISERSEKKEINSERLRKIVKEASEQSGRYFLPKLNDPVKIEKVLLDSDVLYAAFDPKGRPFDGEVLKDIKDHISMTGEVSGKKGRVRSLGIFVGPEGGWSDDELKFFDDNDVAVFSLGEQILRSETAAIVLSALFLMIR